MKIFSMKKIIIAILYIVSTAVYAQSDIYSIKNIDVNTKYSDFGVSYYKDDKVIFASSRKDKAKYSKKWRPNNQLFLELYEGLIGKDGEIDSLQLFSDNINTKYHESNAVFTKDGTTVYFSSNNYLDKNYKTDKNKVNLIQLYRAKVDKDGNWSDIQPMPFNSKEYQTGHPALNEAEDKLYFVSDMPGTRGLTDIYVVDIYWDGSYGLPRNLGPNINTPRKQMFPFVKDNILYFASDDIVDGFGGLDLYHVPLNKDGLVKERAKNMGAPLNSALDDFSIVFAEDGNTGYFSSNREGGKGDDDIYYFTRKRCMQTIVGVVTNSETKEILPNTEVKIIDVEKDKVLTKVVSDENGKYSFTIRCSKRYKIETSKEEYKPAVADVLATSVFDFGHTKDLALTPVVPEKFVKERGKIMVKINPIYFDYDRSFIRPDAEFELKKIVEIVKEYPNIILEFGSHTDSRGSDSYNLKLSQRRAMSTINWLLENGVPSKNIQGKGFGETQLVNKCNNGVDCNEYEHQLNRRSEFVVLNPEIFE